MSGAGRRHGSDPTRVPSREKKNRHESRGNERTNGPRWDTGGQEPAPYPSARRGPASTHRSHHARFQGRGHGHLATIDRLQQSASLGGFGLQLSWQLVRCTLTVQDLLHQRMKPPTHRVSLSSSRKRSYARCMRIFRAATVVPTRLAISSYERSSTCFNTNTSRLLLRQCRQRRLQRLAGAPPAPVALPDVRGRDLGRCLQIALAPCAPLLRKAAIAQDQEEPAGEVRPGPGIAPTGRTPVQTRPAPRLRHRRRTRAAGTRSARTGSGTGAPAPRTGLRRRQVRPAPLRHRGRP